MWTIYWIICILFFKRLTGLKEVSVCEMRKCICFKTIVNCSRKHVFEIGYAQPSTIIYDMSYNKLNPVLSKWMFHKIKDSTTLKDILLVGNRFTKIREDAFEDLRFLELLNLGENLLTHIIPGSFKSLRNLKSLYLYKNFLQAIDPLVFVTLSKLEHLDLSFNRITSLNEKDMIALTTLKILNLRGNEITKLKAHTFGPLKYLDTKLDLSQNEISIIEPNSLSDLRWVSYLDLSFNSIQSLPQNCFQNLKNLKYLDLSVNLLTHLEKTYFGYLPVLHKLNLHYNNIEEINPEAFTKLPKLNILDMSKNAISSIPGYVFEYIKHLKILTLQTNQIKEIDPKAFHKLSFLEIIDLSSNKLSNIKRGVFQHLRSIKTINLHRNSNPFVSGISLFTIPSLKNVLLDKGKYCKPALNSNRSTLQLNIKKENCLGAREILPFNQKCRICQSTSTYGECLDTDKVESCPKQNTTLTACLNTFNYSDTGHVSVSEQCSDYNNCLKLESENGQRCTVWNLNVIEEMYCNFCCIGKHCSFEQIGARTRDTTFYVSFTIAGQWSEKLPYKNLFNILEKAFYMDMDDIIGGYSISSICFRPPVAYLKIYSTSLNIFSEVYIQNLTQERILKGIQTGSLNLFEINGESVLVTSEEFKFHKNGTICKDGRVFDNGTVYKDGKEFEGYCFLTKEEKKFIEGPKFKEYLSCEELDEVFLLNKSRQLFSQVEKLLESTDDFNATSPVNIVGKLITLPDAMTSKTTVSPILSTIVRLLGTLSEKEEVKMLKHLDSVVNNISLAHHDFEYITPKLALAAIYLNLDDFKGLSLSVVGDLDQQSLSDITVKLKNASDIGDLRQKKSTIITIPETMVMFMEQNTFPEVNRITFKVYHPDNPFAKRHFIVTGENSDILDLNKVINSYIIVASIPNVAVKDLQEPILISFAHLNKQSFTPKCVFWDVMKGLSRNFSQGCVMYDRVNSSFTVCACYRLGGFALLMNIYEIVDGSALRLLGTEEFQEMLIVFFIGCAICLLALIMTLLVFFMFRELRQDQLTKIRINLWITLATSNLIFIIGMQNYVFSNTTLCIVFGVLLHYLLLSSVMWMLVQEIFMYISPKKRPDNSFEHSMMKLCLIVWGFPLMIIGLSIIGYGSSHGFIDSKICWVTTQAMLITILIPILMINIGAVCLLLQQFMKPNPPNMKTIFSKFLTVMIVIFLFDLAYTFVSIGFKEAEIYAFFLFTMFNTCLGVSIFIFYCVLDKDVYVLCKERIKTCFHSPNSGKTKTGPETSLADTSDDKMNKSKTYHSVGHGVQPSDQNTDKVAGLKPDDEVTELE